MNIFKVKKVSLILVLTALFSFNVYASKTLEKVKKKWVSKLWS